MKVLVEIVHADGSIETFPVNRETATLGRSLEADISIPDARDLEPQHIRLRPEPAGCNVDVLDSARTPVLVAGKAFYAGRLPWGAELVVGDLRVRILSGESKSAIGLSTILSLALLIGAGVFLYVFMTGGGIELDLRSNRDAPPILPGDVTCPFQGERALRRAEHLVESAEAKSDRYPFDPQDGIAAVELYGYAIACFRAAGEREGERRTTARAAVLRERVQEDYTTHRLGLERALETEELEDALREAITLYRYVSHTDTDYERWLVAMIQKLELRVQEEEEDD